jgi:hypothetical protein
LTLLKKEEKGRIDEVVKANTPALNTEYKFLKSMAHISVWLNVVLQSLVNRTENVNEDKEELLRIKSHLHVLRKWNNTLQESEHSVIDSLIHLIEQVLVTSSLNEITLLRKKYLTEMFDANKRYAQRATELQLNGMHHIMSSWFKEYRLNLEATRVLIVCAHGPKRNLIEIQYFLDLYAKHGFPNAEKAKGLVIPVTMLDEQIRKVKQKQLITFLRTYILNSDIGKDMLDDDMAMTKDVLGPYAPAVLERQACPFHNASKALKNLSHFAVKKEITAVDDSSLGFTKK